LEGSIVNVPPQGGRKHPEQKLIPVNTQNILFICGGAFDGIEKRIASRLNTKTVGYSAAKEVHKIDRENLLQYIAPQDLKSFGLIPEIIGRLPILTYLDPLNRDALRRILVEPKNSIVKQYAKLFAMDHVQLTFTDEALDYIVDKAIEYKLGARGLRSLTESVIMDYMYSIPSEKVEQLEITREIVAEKLTKNINA
jgi:ATP-dependent Clp protease ATP-binding subunit ClpX